MQQDFIKIADKHYSNSSNARRAARAAGLAVFLIQHDEDGYFIMAPEAQIEEVQPPGFDAPTIASTLADPTVQAAMKEGASEEMRKAKKAKDRRAILPPKARYVDVTETNEEEDSVKTPKQTLKTARKPSSKPSPAARKREQDEGSPSGMVAECLRLAGRKNGVTPAQLNEATGWQKAPWKWLFSNPKGTGFCDRWGYKLEVVKDGRDVTYFVSKA